MSKKYINKKIIIIISLVISIGFIFVLINNKNHYSNNSSNSISSKSINTNSTKFDYKYYSEQIQKDDKNAWLFFERAKIARAQWYDYEKILSDYNIAIKLDPNNYEYYFARADLKYFYKDYTSALFDINKAKELKQNDQELLYLESQLLLWLWNTQKAIEGVNYLIKLNDKVSKYFELRWDIKHSLNEYTWAIQDLDKAIELWWISWTYYLRWLSKFKLKNYEWALIDINKAIDMYPNLNFISLKWKILMHLWKYNEAKELYNSLLKNEKLSKSFLWNIYSNLWEINIENKDYKQAIIDLDKSINLWNKESYYLRWKLNLSLKKYQNALNDFLNSDTKTSSNINYYIWITNLSLNNKNTACSYFDLWKKSWDQKSIIEFNKSCK